MTKSTKTVVVGGGISGLLAARIAAEQGDHVVLVEQAAEVGGLLRSHKGPSGCYFDMGTHFIAQTTIPEANAFLFEDLDFDNCYRFCDSLKEGNYFNGVLNQESGSIDTRTLDPATHAAGLVELLNSDPQQTTYQNLEAFLLDNYGPTFTENVYRPAMLALTGTDLTELHESAHRSFLITRLIVLGSLASREIKKSTHFDARIAWARNSDGYSNIEKLYPKTGGTGGWISGLEARCRKKGVEILTSRKISAIDSIAGTVSKITFTDGTLLPVDRMVWTAPPLQFLNASGVPLKSQPPKFRTVFLIDFIFDQELNTDRHFICCYDPDLLPFRITLYPNITNGPRKPPPHHLTVEILTDGDDPTALVARAAEDLRTMGIVPREAKILYSNTSSIRPGWPIITNKFAENADALTEIARENGKNVIFAGRGKGENAHFMNEVLEGVFTTLSQ